MKPVIAVTLYVCILLIATILTNPSILIRGKHVRILYWFVPLFGAIFLLISGLLPVNNLLKGLTASGSINPIKILVLFISMTMLSIFLDEAGMFRYLANLSIKYAKADQRKLFLYLFLMVSVLTVFTSNDIIILTFTPFICYFSKNAKVNPLPYLFGEFVAANTWSMMLIIGNPTNIYLASTAGLSFFGYTKIMALPTLFAGTAAFLILYLIFRKELAKPLSESDSTVVIEDKVLIIIGVIHLGLCTLLLVVSSYIGLEMWLITLCFALSLFICISIYKLVMKRKHVKKAPTPQTEHILLHTFTRAPWELIPFVLSMFALVLSLEEYKVTSLIADAFGSSLPIIKYGVASFLTANFMNNIPMSVLFGSVTANAVPEISTKAVFASIIGSNLGAYFTPLGALAGIMWSSILKRMGVDFSFTRFIRYGAPIALVTLASALLGLAIVL